MKDVKGFLLAAAVGLIMGGGLSAAVGSHNLAVAVERFEKEIIEVRSEIDDVKDDEEKTFDAVMELAIAMARVEEKVDALAR